MKKSGKIGGVHIKDIIKQGDKLIKLYSFPNGTDGQRNIINITALSGYTLFFCNIGIQNNEILFSRVTKKQYEMICLYETYQSYTKIIEHEPNVTKRMLSDCLNGAEYWLMKENVTLIQHILHSILIPQ